MVRNALNLNNVGYETPGTQYARVACTYYGKGMRGKTWVWGRSCPLPLVATCPGECQSRQLADTKTVCIGSCVIIIISRSSSSSHLSSRSRPHNDTPNAVLMAYYFDLSSWVGLYGGNTVWWLCTIPRVRWNGNYRGNYIYVYLCYVKTLFICS